MSSSKSQAPFLVLGRALLTMAGLLSLTTPPTRAADGVQPASQAGARVLQIAPRAFAGSSVNVIAGLQNTLFTHADFQYAGFYDAEGTLVLARRKVNSDTWETRATPHKGNVSDAHNTVALVVDGAGFLHVAWDHHGHPLNYARSVAPHSLELGPKQGMTGVREKRVTYPAFLALPNGDLLFLYRDGASGRGDLVLNRFDVRSGTWGNQHPQLIDGEGQRSAYVATTIDRKGRLHLAWVWRDSPDVATNHDLCYARSDDAGATWVTSEGKPLTVPITAGTAEYALHIPKNRSLMNSPSIATDERGEPYLVDYWKPDGSDVPQYHVVWKDEGGWRSQQITQRATPFTLSGTSTKRPPISRSVAVINSGAGKPREVYVVYRDDEHGGHVVAVECRDFPKAKWVLRELTSTPVGAWEPSYDPAAWQHSQQLHLLVQDVVQRDGNDREAAPVPPSPIGSLVWKP